MSASDLVPRELVGMANSRLTVYSKLVEDSPMAAAELADELDASKATIYRCVKDLEDAGIAESEIAVDLSAANNQKQVWRIVEGGGEDGAE